MICQEVDIETGVRSSKTSTLTYNPTRKTFSLNQTQIPANFPVHYQLLGTSTYVYLSPTKILWLPPQSLQKFEETRVVHSVPTLRIPSISTQILASESVTVDKMAFVHCGTYNRHHDCFVGIGAGRVDVRDAENRLCYRGHIGKIGFQDGVKGMALGDAVFYFWKELEYYQAKFIIQSMVEEQRGRLEANQQMSEQQQVEKMEMEQEIEQVEQKQKITNKLQVIQEMEEENIQIQQQQQMPLSNSELINKNKQRIQKRVERVQLPQLIEQPMLVELAQEPIQIKISYEPQQSQQQPLQSQPWQPHKCQTQAQYQNEIQPQVLNEIQPQQPKNPKQPLQQQHQQAEQLPKTPQKNMQNQPMKIQPQPQQQPHEQKMQEPAMQEEVQNVQVDRDHQMKESNMMVEKEGEQEQQQQVKSPLPKSVVLQDQKEKYYNQVAKDSGFKLMRRMIKKYNYRLDGTKRITRRNRTKKPILQLPTPKKAQKSSLPYKTSSKKSSRIPFITAPLIETPIKSNNEDPYQESQSRSCLNILSTVFKMALQNYGEAGIKAELCVMIDSDVVDVRRVDSKLYFYKSQFKEGNKAEPVQLAQLLYQLPQSQSQHQSPLTTPLPAKVLHHPTLGLLLYANPNLPYLHSYNLSTKTYSWHYVNGIILDMTLNQQGMLIGLHSNRIFMYDLVKEERSVAVFYKSVHDFARISNVYGGHPRPTDKQPASQGLGRNQGTEEDFGVGGVDGSVRLFNLGGFKKAVNKFKMPQGITSLQVSGSGNHILCRYGHKAHIICCKNKTQSSLFSSKTKFTDRTSTKTLMKGFQHLSHLQFLQNPAQDQILGIDDKENKLVVINVEDGTIVGVEKLTGQAARVDYLGCSGKWVVYGGEAGYWRQHLGIGL